MKTLIIKTSSIFLFFIVFQINTIAQEISITNKNLCKSEIAELKLENYFSGSTIAWQKLDNGTFQDLKDENKPILKLPNLNNESTSTIRCKVVNASQISFTNSVLIKWLELPKAKIQIDAPCADQITRFSVFEKDNDITNYDWKIGNNFESSAESPEVRFEKGIDITYSLKITNDKGCYSTIFSRVLINPKPNIGMIYDSIICGNSITKFELKKPKEKFQNIKWDISPSSSSFYTIIGTNSDSILNVKWKTVSEPQNLQVSVKIKDQKGCYSGLSNLVLLKTEFSPDLGKIFQKPDKSDVLIYSDNSALNNKSKLEYQWGVNSDLRSTQYYCLFPGLDPIKNNYWIETHFKNQPTCITRNYFDIKDFIAFVSDKNAEMLIYPNPSNGLISFNLNENFLSKKVGFEIRDIAGNLVLVLEDKKIESSTVSLNLDMLKEGFYIVKLLCNNEVLGSAKFLINK